MTHDCIHVPGKVNDVIKVAGHRISTTRQDKICPFCSGKTERVKVTYFYQGVDLGKYEVNKCKRCGEEILGIDTQKEIQRRADKLGLYWVGLGPKPFQKVYADEGMKSKEYGVVIDASSSDA